MGEVGLSAFTTTQYRCIEPSSSGCIHLSGILHEMRYNTRASFLQLQLPASKTDCGVPPLHPLGLLVSACLDQAQENYHRSCSPPHGPGTAICGIGSRQKFHQLVLRASACLSISRRGRATLPIMVAIGKYLLLPRAAWHFRLLQEYRSSAVTRSSSAGVV
jgi:hypothetical protein